MSIPFFLLFFFAVPIVTEGKRCNNQDDAEDRGPMWKSASYGLAKLFWLLSAVFHLSRGCDYPILNVRVEVGEKGGFEAH